MVDALSWYPMDLSVHRAVLLAMAVAGSTVCCSQLLDVVASGRDFAGQFVVAERGS
jgi:hypothetical protein